MTSYDVRPSRDSQRGGVGTVTTSSDAAQTGGGNTQPVEFDHAIIYVNKIKVRLSVCLSVCLSQSTVVIIVQ